MQGMDPVSRIVALSRTLLAALLALLLAGPAPASILDRDAKDSASGSVSHQKRKAAGVWVNVVTVDLNNPDLLLRPLLAPHGQRAPFGRLVKGAKPLAAINGTFFDPPTGIVLGTVVQSGRLVREGWLGSAIRVDNAGQGSLLPLKGLAGRYFDWSDIEFAVSSGPTLLQNGEIALNPWAEGFTDPAVYRPARRSALGLTRANKLLMVTVSKPVSLRRLAMAMQALGAVQAINLDGGSSSGLYYQGSTLVKPARSLTNALGVFVRPRTPGLPANLTHARRALAHYQKAVDLLNRRDSVRARAHFLRSVSLEPDEPSYWSGLAAAQERLGMKADAVGSLVRSAALYLEAGRAGPSREVALRAVRLNGARADAWLALGRASARTGHAAQAREALERVLTLRPGHATARELLQNL